MHVLPHFVPGQGLRHLTPSGSASQAAWTDALSATTFTASSEKSSRQTLQRAPLLRKMASLAERESFWRIGFRPFWLRDSGKDTSFCKEPPSSFHFKLFLTSFRYDSFFILRIHALPPQVKISLGSTSRRSPLTSPFFPKPFWTFWPAIIAPCLPGCTNKSNHMKLLLSSSKNPYLLSILETKSSQFLCWISFFHLNLPPTFIKEAKLPAPQSGSPAELQPLPPLATPPPCCGHHSPRRLRRWARALGASPGWAAALGRPRIQRAECSQCTRGASTWSHLRSNVFGCKFVGFILLVDSFSFATWLLCQKSALLRVEVTLSEQKISGWQDGFESLLLWCSSWCKICLQ